MQDILDQKVNWPSQSIILKISLTLVFMLILTISLGFIINQRPKETILLTGKMDSVIAQRGSNNLSPLVIRENKIFDSSGQPVRLIGVASSLYRFHESNASADQLKSRVLESKKWGVNFVVLYLDQPAELISKHDEIVAFAAWANSNGLYVLLSPVVNGSENQVYNPDVAPNQKLFSAIDARLNEILIKLANDLKDYPNVIYSTGTEPHNVSNELWLDQQNELIKSIRIINPKSIVVISALDWGHNIKHYANNPLPMANILYDWHYYVAPNKFGVDLGSCRLPYWDAKMLPILVGEFGGTTLSDFGSYEDLLCIEKILESFKLENISYAMYTIDVVESEKFSGLSLMTKDGRLTPKGQLFVNSLQKDN